MKTILRHLAIIALCCISLVHASHAEQPKTLEDALLNYSWSWNDLGSDGKDHWKTVLRFEEEHHIQNQPGWA